MLFTLHFTLITFTFAITLTEIIFEILHLSSIFQKLQITVSELLLIVILTLSSLFHFSLFILSCLSMS